jgi:hypothetical protein
MVLLAIALEGYALGEEWLEPPVMRHRITR